MVKKFPTFDRTRNFATNLKIAHNLFRSFVWWNMSLCFHPIPVRYISTVFYHPRLGLVSILFTSDFFLVNFPYAFRPYFLHASPIFIIICNTK